MTAYKKNRVVAAVTVNSIILIVIIIAVLIYQMVEMGTLAAKRAAIQEQIQSYEQLIDEESKNLDYYLSEQYLINKAYEYGYRFPD